MTDAIPHAAAFDSPADSDANAASKGLSREKSGAGLASSPLSKTMPSSVPVTAAARGGDQFQPSEADGAGGPVTATGALSHTSSPRSTSACSGRSPVCGSVAPPPHRRPTIPMDVDAVNSVAASNHHYATSLGAKVVTSQSTSPCALAGRVSSAVTHEHSPLRDRVDPAMRELLSLGDTNQSPLRYPSRSISHASSGRYAHDPYSTVCSQRVQVDPGTMGVSSRTPSFRSPTPASPIAGEQQYSRATSIPGVTVIPNIASQFYANSEPRRPAASPIGLAPDDAVRQRMAAGSPRDFLGGTLSPPAPVMEDEPLAQTPPPADGATDGTDGSKKRDRKNKRKKLRRLTDVPPPARMRYIPPPPPPMKLVANEKIVSFEKYCSIVRRWYDRTIACEKCYTWRVGGMQCPRMDDYPYSFDQWMADVQHWWSTWMSYAAAERPEYTSAHLTPSQPSFANSANTTPAIGASAQSPAQPQYSPGVIQPVSIYQQQQQQQQHKTHPLSASQYMQSSISSRSCSTSSAGGMTNWNSIQYADGDRYSCVATTTASGSRPPSIQQGIGNSPAMHSLQSSIPPYAEQLAVPLGHPKGPSTSPYIAHTFASTSSASSSVPHGYSPPPQPAPQAQYGGYTNPSYGNYYSAGLVTNAAPNASVAPQHIQSQSLQPQSAPGQYYYNPATSQTSGSYTQYPVAAPNLSLSNNAYQQTYGVRSGSVPANAGAMYTYPPQGPPQVPNGVYYA